MKQTLCSPKKIRALLLVVLALFFSATLYADGLPGELRSAGAICLPDTRPRQTLRL